jgi:phospholipase/carboxylesterase
VLRVNIAQDGGDRLLVLLHGYGADEADLAPLAPYLDPERRFFAVCPRAPIDLEPYGGAAWYARSEAGVIDQATFCGSLVELDHTIDALCQDRGLDRSRMVVIGFSQGAAMTLALAFRRSTKPRPAAVACLSGMLAEPDWLLYDWDAAAAPPVCVQHGVHDPMLDVSKARHVRDTLLAHGIEPTYREYPMQHEIRPDSIADLRSWLERV